MICAAPPHNSLRVFGGSVAVYGREEADPVLSVRTAAQLAAFANHYSPKGSLFFWPGQRQLDLQGGTDSGWALDGQRSAERFYPVGEADQA